MSTMAEELTEFLLARIAEDEHTASEAAGSHTAARLEGQPPVWVGHVSAWSPWRVLADCAARRQIVVGCPNLDRALTDHGVPSPFSGEDVLRLLALPYSAHPDYRPEWRP